MNLLNDLSENELCEINGGESFAYRVGQLIALCAYHSNGVPSYGAIKAEIDWFGE